MTSSLSYKEDNLNDLAKGYFFVGMKVLPVFASSLRFLCVCLLWWSQILSAFSIFIDQDQHATVNASLYYPQNYLCSNPDNLKNGQMMKTNVGGYRVYIVRSWQESTSQVDAIAQRFVLEVPATGERIGCKSLDALWILLKAKILTAQPTCSGCNTIEDELI